MRTTINSNVMIKELVSFFYNKLFDKEHDRLDVLLLLVCNLKKIHRTNNITKKPTFYRKIYFA